MSMFDFLRPKVTKEVVRIHDSDRTSGSRSFGGGRTKYGNIHYHNAGWTDYNGQRENARGVYHESLVARGMVGRLVDNVINTGLTWESSPLWDMIPGWKNKTGEEKYQWTSEVENRWTLYANSKEADVKGRLTLAQIQRLLYQLRIVEGEYFVICRYVGGADRMSPLTAQVLNNDQIVDPRDASVIAAIKARGATVKEGIEYDSTGKMIAIHIAEGENLFSSKTKRIAIFGPKSKRRFVIHGANFDNAEQFRGFPELSAFVYELDRLTEYDISELEGVVAQAQWMAAIEMDKDAKRNPSPLKPAGLSNANSDIDTVEGGVETISTIKKGLVLQNLKPGQTMKMFTPTRPNPNYETYTDAVMNNICGDLGMPLSVFKQKFQASYSAARAEILFFWNNVIKRRDDFTSDFLIPFYQAWFTEEVEAGNIKAPGFKGMPVARQAWLYGTWNGISRPVVDPVKEVKAVEARQKLGHTTGEREAKAYNGSDFRENVKRLKTENSLIAEANEPLDPAQYDPSQTEQQAEDNSSSDLENN